MTYLRFRSAVKKNRMERRIPQKARSPLQPFLALYGLTFSSILRTGSPLSSFRLRSVVLQGFQVFSRGNEFWAWTSNSWGYTIAPWIALLLIIILIFGFQCYSTRRIWEWDFPSWRAIDLSTGTARDEPKPKRPNEVPNGTGDDSNTGRRYEYEEDQPSLQDRINRFLDAI